MGSLLLVVGAVLVALLSSLLKVFLNLTWRPYALTRDLQRQGVRGPPYKVWTGSLQEMSSIRNAAMKQVLDNRSHDITVRVNPHFRKWMDQYGSTFLFWFGAELRICITDLEMVKQVLFNKSGLYPKITPSPNIRALFGDKGLVLVEGSEWVTHRRIISPAFTMDKLKMLTKEMAECVKAMLDQWQDQIMQAQNDQKEIEVAKELQELTANVISHTAFGSSYMEGKEVFLAQRELQRLVVKTNLSINIPGLRYLPTKKNVYKWKLERSIREKLMGIIQRRLKGSMYGNDLLGLMMEANMKEEGQMMSMDEIIDECKTFFFAGNDTTSLLLTWALFLLSTYQDWQEKLREEVLRECNMEVPNADMLSKLKLVTMVLLETLRLYGPFPLIQRKTGKDITLGNITIPENTQLIMPTAIIHRNKDIWGADAEEFNPYRFENGISKAASHPNALLSFSIGPRSCIGQNFALLEAKTAIAMILQRLSFSLSPNYKHAPVDFVGLQPQYGVPIIFRSL